MSKKQFAIIIFNIQIINTRMKKQRENNFTTRLENATTNTKTNEKKRVYSAKPSVYEMCCIEFCYDAMSSKRRNNNRNTVVEIDCSSNMSSMPVIHFVVVCIRMHLLGECTHLVSMNELA